MNVRHSTINWIIVAVVAIGGAVAGGVWGARRGAVSQSQPAERDVISHLTNAEGGSDILVGVCALLGGILGLMLSAAPLTVLSAFQARAIWYKARGSTRAALQSAMHDVQNRKSVAAPVRPSDRPQLPHDSRDQGNPPA